MGRKGFSFVEILVSLGILGLMVPVALGVVVQSMNMNRKSNEKSEASFYAQEGIEALRSIARDDWNSVTPGNYGLDTNTGAWQLVNNGDSRGKFNRVITVGQLYRDVSGNLVESGGVVDPDAYVINSTVSWNWNGNISNQVENKAYLTNYWKVFWNAGDAQIMYSGAGTQPYWRYYTESDNEISDQNNTVNGLSARVLALATSPNQGESVVAYVSTTGVMNVMCFDGTEWSLDWSVTVGGNATTRRFDVGYESNTGDAIVVYSRNVGTTNEIGFRTKNGDSECGSANWSAESTFNPVRTSGTIRWIKLAEDRRDSSNSIGVAWLDSNNDLSAGIWNGSNIANEPSTISDTDLDYVSSAGDIDAFDLEYESLSGDLMFIWGSAAGSNGSNGIYYRTCTGGVPTCTWSTWFTSATFRDDGTTMDLGANPLSDEMVFASVGNAGSDLQIGYWSGSAWTNRANVDTSCSAVIAGSKQVAVGWVNISGVGSRSLVAYADANSTRVNWYVGSGSTFTVQTDFNPTPAFATTHSWLEFLQTTNDSFDRQILAIVDSNSRLHLKRVVWSGGTTYGWTNVNSSDGLSGTLNQRVVYPMALDYWKSTN